MQITANTTPFLAELFTATDKHARRHVVVVVKGTFDVSPDGECRPAEEQVPFVYTDEHYGDPGSTSIRLECDFVPVKPLAEVLLLGDAVAPRGRPVRELEVALAGPGFSKRAIVTGDRIWEEGLRGVQPSLARPFLKMPLRWERAFGGSDHSHERKFLNGTELRNPIGIGFHLNGAKETILGTRLPNIERPDARQNVWSEQPEPCGFAIVGRGWRPRISFAGTYDQHWLDEIFPFLPEDFDDRYFQSAPLDQQIGGLPAGAAFGCLNTSEAERFVARLPETAVPIRFCFDNREEEATPQPDTLILEPSVGRIVLLRRASRPLGRKPTALREILVGHKRRAVSRHKPRYRSLGELIAARRPR